MLAETTFALAAAVALQEHRVVARVPDGVEVVEGTLRFSPNGATAAYVARLDEKLHAATLEKIGPSYASIAPPVLDAAGEHVAFRAVRSTGRVDPECVVLLDGREYAREAWIGEVSLSPKDATPAYWAALGMSVGAGGRYELGPYVLCFGKKQSDKLQAGGLWPAFSADGECVYGTGSKSGQWSVLWLDRRGRQGEIALGHALDARPRPDGRELACTIRDDGIFVERWALPAKGEPMVVTRLGRDHRAAGGPVYSADGSRIAFKVLAGGKLGVALSEDETADCAHDFVDDIAFDPSGNTVAFVASSGCELDVAAGTDDEVLDLEWGVLDDYLIAEGGRWCVVIGPDRTREHDCTRSPVWSPDGSRVAYAALDQGKWRVVVHDGPTSAPADEIALLVWAPDSRALWYGCRRDRELCWSSLALD